VEAGLKLAALHGPGARDRSRGGLCSGFESVNDSELANRCWNSSSWLAVPDMIDLRLRHS
jgi:hypothetical protein